MSGEANESEIGEISFVLLGLKLLVRSEHVLLFQERKNREKEERCGAVGGAWLIAAVSAFGYMLDFEVSLRFCFPWLGVGRSS